MRDLAALRRNAAMTAAALGTADREYISTGGEAETGQFFVVKVKQTGGSAGDEDSPCTYTYDVWQLGQEPDVDTPIAGELTPLDHERTAAGRYRWNTYMNASWNYGTAFRDAGAWKLWQVAGEVAEYTTCSTGG